MASPNDNAQLGEITILLTDLVGSTKLYQDRGNAAARALVESLTRTIGDGTIGDAGQ